MLAICFAYGLFCFIAYQNHQTTYNQKHLSFSYSVANGYEVFLDNIFRQAEFIGHKIETTPNQNKALTVKNYFDAILVWELILILAYLIVG
jgi:hypothetical protein